MKKKYNRGRPKQSDSFRLEAVQREEIDIEKLAQAFISLAKDLAEKRANSSRPVDK